MSSSNCCFLTCITGFSRGRSGGLVFPSLSEFSTVYCDPHSQGFGIVNKAEIDAFLELSCFFHDPADVGNLISGSSAFSKTSLNIRKFMVHVLLKPGFDNFEHYFTSMWDECNCVVVWAFFGIAFLAGKNLLRKYQRQKQTCKQPNKIFFINRRGRNWVLMWQLHVDRDEISLLNSHLGFFCVCKKVAVSWRMCSLWDSRAMCFSSGDRLGDLYWERCYLRFLRNPQ